MSILPESAAAQFEAQGAAWFHVYLDPEDASVQYAFGGVISPDSMISVMEEALGDLYKIVRGDLDVVQQIEIDRRALGTADEPVPLDYDANGQVL